MRPGHSQINIQGGSSVVGVWVTLDPTALTKVDTNAVETTTPSDEGSGWFKYSFDGSTRMTALGDLLRYQGLDIGLDFDTSKAVDIKIETRNPNAPRVAVGVMLSASSFAEGQITQSYVSAASVPSDKLLHKIRELSIGFTPSVTGGVDIGQDQVMLLRVQSIGGSTEIESMATVVSAVDYDVDVIGRIDDSITDAALTGDAKIGIAIGAITAQRSDAEIEARISYRIVSWE